MPAILAARAEQPYRLSATLDSVPSTSVAAYALTLDGGAAVATLVTLAWTSASAPHTVQLALSERLVEGRIYRLAISGAGSAVVVYRAAVPDGIDEPSDRDDPVAEAYGVDVAWLTGALGPSGRLPRRRGLDAVRYDLVAAALTRPGELYQHPEDGAALHDDVNGPGAAQDAQALAARLRRQWARDPRVERGGVSVSAAVDGSGRVVVDASVRTTAVDTPLRLRLEGT